MGVSRAFHGMASIFSSGCTHVTLFVLLRGVGSGILPHSPCFARYCRTKWKFSVSRRTLWFYHLSRHAHVFCLLIQRAWTIVPMTSVVGRWYQLGAACTRLPFCVTLLFCMPNCVTECFLFTPAQSDPDVILITQGAPCVITGGIFKVRVWGTILLL